MVDSVATTATMTVLGFRQFLLMPNQNATNLNASDASGRFIGMYIGSVAPVPQGRFDGCTQTAGPGKVVLHQRGARLIARRGRRRGGSALLEDRDGFCPILLALLIGTVELARVIYTYYMLEKTMSDIARYLGTQMGVNFCNSSDPIMVSAINNAVTGTADASGTPVISGLTPAMIQVAIERYDASSQAMVPQCDCSATGCDASHCGRGEAWLSCGLDQWRLQRAPALLGLRDRAVPAQPDCEDALWRHVSACGAAARSASSSCCCSRACSCLR